MSFFGQSSPLPQSLTPRSFFSISFLPYLAQKSEGDPHCENMVDMESRKRARLHLVSFDDSDDESLSSSLSSMTSDGSNQSQGRQCPPPSFSCPLTREIMFDPVLDTEGNTFERKALMHWLEETPTSPLSGQPLAAHTIIPNIALRGAIHEYMGAQWVARKTFQFAHPQEIAASSTAVPVSSSPIRTKISYFLRQHTSYALGGIDLRLNEDGCCAFRHADVTVVLDVPDNVGVFCFYTRDLIPEHIEQSPHRVQLYRTALEMNFLQGETRGGCLSVRTHDDGDSELLFSYTDRVRDIGAEDFTNILLNFVSTMLTLRSKLLSSLERSKVDGSSSPEVTTSSSVADLHQVPTTIG
jgi:hypothetical protein